MGTVLKIRDDNGNWIDVSALIGAKGDKPVKGVDYWTEADKEELVQETLSLILSGDEVSY